MTFPLPDIEVPSRLFLLFFSFSRQSSLPNTASCKKKIRQYIRKVTAVLYQTLAGKNPHLAPLSRTSASEISATCPSRVRTSVMSANITSGRGGTMTSVQSTRNGFSDACARLSGRRSLTLFAWMRQWSVSDSMFPFESSFARVEIVRSG